jgi:hypothetical protein
MMGLSQLRVELVVATGIIGASLIAATLSGCQTDSMTPPGQGGLLSQFNHTPGGQQAGYPNAQQSPYSSANGMSMAQNGGMPQGQAMPQGQSMSPYAGMTPTNGMSPAGGMSPSMGMAQSGYPDNRQAFMSETQRIGAQQGISAQDIVAMSRSGMTDQQIAMAVSQRGDTLRSTPGVGAYLAQNGVNPAVLNGTAPSAGNYPPLQGQPFPSQTGFPTSSQSAAPQYTAAQYQAAQPANSQYAGQQYPAQQYATQPVAQMSYQNAGPATPFSAVSATGSSPTMQGGGFPTAQAESGAMQPTSFDSSSSSPAAASGAAMDSSTANAMPAQSWRPMAR